MNKEELKKMSDSELNNLLNDKLYSLNKLINTCKMLKTKNIKDNVLIKDYLVKIDDIKNELKERG